MSGSDPKSFDSINEKTERTLFDIKLLHVPDSFSLIPPIYN